ncbi:DUF4175 family protein [Roseomonas sp. KE2513]|uniref:DUF4175 domain-containing protein n=1 Tax=Roseomonas sp. KE2513 TaxID=2479202 RepID=UPI0018E05D41|nr:DUF4175 family protein [Roseomonas sp. KE2513]MBI0536233.1 DUF4175 family protein [Roseomonas sp. KE2513]
MTGPGPGAAARGPALRRLGRLRARARAALFWEALWPRLWPVLGVLGVFLVLALSGVFLLLHPLPHLLLLGVLTGALVVAVLHGLRGLSLPDEPAADRRLERASGLPHRPLAALHDRPAGGDATSLALWRLHQAREAARIRALRAGVPRPGLPARDPRALRAGLAVALVASLVAAGAEAPERLRRALWPAAAPAVPGLSAQLEAWVTPPAYTGAAPVFLDPAGGSVTAPAGSRLRVALSGGSGAPELLRDGSPAAAFQALGPGSHSAEMVLDAGGQLAVRQGGRDVAAWSLAVQADAPPRIAFAEPPAQAVRGLGTRLPWRAEDDWGVASAAAELRLAARPDAPPLVIDLPLPPGQPKAPRGVAQPDLSAHPWAGLPVRVSLLARDGAGQEGRSDEAALTLPERTFNHPIARGLILLRKGLSLDPSQRRPAMEGLERLAGQPDAFENDTATALALRSARTRLESDTRPEAVGEVQQTMWETALALEEGRADRTARALAETRERLREALRERQQQERERAEERQREADRQEAEQRREQEARQNGEPPPREADQAQPPGENNQTAANQEQQQREAQRDAARTETDRRIQELRDAVRRHLDALAERIQRDSGETPPEAPPPQARPQERREAERRTDRMREQNREDRPEDAERELAELEKMLEDLENGQMAENRREERRQRRERGQQQMGVIQDMVRRESGLLDGAHRRSEAESARRERERRQSYPWNRGLPPEPQAQPTPPETTADARVQRALRRALGELMQQQGDLTGEVPAPLGRADQAMRDSAEALGSGADPRPHQERAIRELSEGGRQMAQRMQRQFGRPDRPQPGEEEGEGEGEGQGDAMADGSERGGEGQDQMAQNGEGRDPLGRRLREGTGTSEEGGDTRVPEEAEMLRTRRLQEELRRRHAERERPTAELDYIDRLLRLF